MYLVSDDVPGDVPMMYRRKNGETGKMGKMGEKGGQWGKLGENDMASSKITKSPRCRPSGRPWASFLCIPKSDAVIFFISFDLIARLSSFENHVAVTHFLSGSVITFTWDIFNPLVSYNVFHTG